MTKVKALSIRQPWAWLIVAGYKDVENRKWATDFKGRIYIHASRTLDRDALVYLTSQCMKINQDVRDVVRKQNSWTLGAIIGEVEITDCVMRSDSPWFSGPYGFVLKNPILYEKSIACRGKLGFFKPDIA
jgi:hypothetical protein